MEKALYYVYEFDDGRKGQVVKIINGVAYRFHNGKWEENAGLIKILFENTNYEEITEEEAMKIIKNDT